MYTLTLQFFKGFHVFLAIQRIRKLSCKASFPYKVKHVFHSIRESILGFYGLDEQMNGKKIGGWEGSECSRQ